MWQSKRRGAMLALKTGAALGVLITLAACGNPAPQSAQNSRADRGEAATRKGETYAPPDFEALAGYPEGWYISAGWPGPFVEGFAVLDAAVTVQGRAKPNPDAPQTVSCTLPALANFQAWNLARVAEDELEFFVATKTLDIEISQAAEIETVTDDGTSVLAVKPGDVLTYLQFLGDGDATVAFKGQLVSIQLADLEEVSTAGLIEDRSDKWARVKCASGTQAWLNLDDMLRTEGVAPSPIGRFGDATDLTEEDAMKLKGQLEDLQRFEDEQNVSVASEPVEGGTVD